MVEAVSPLIVGIGFLLGLEHAFDADHIVAVSAIVCNTKSFKKSLVLGTVWGLGHSVAIFLVGALVLTLSVIIPEGLTDLFEVIAGVMLVILGVYVIRGLLVERARLSHQSEGENGHQHNVHAEHGHSHRSFLTGALQGLGGSAALMLVTLSTVGSATLGILFMAVFGVGVILGMLIIGTLIGGLVAFTAVRTNKINEAIRAITGSVSIGFGIFIITSILLMGKTVI